MRGQRGTSTAETQPYRRPFEPFMSVTLEFSVDALPGGDPEDDD